ncbi:MAG: gamma-glutamyl-gamma-aminobutyrate hydrolase family protein [bacterium]
MNPLVGVTPEIWSDLLKLKKSYTDALIQFGFEACIIPPGGVPDRILARLDGVLFSGGDDIHPSYYGEDLLYDLTLVENARTDFELSLLRACLENDKPVLAICNGMQMMNIALGGSLFQDIEKQCRSALNHRTGSHAIAMNPGFFIGGGSCTVNSSHHQAIKERGKGVQVIAQSEDGIIEAIQITGCRYCVGVQWHPERDTGNIVNRVLFERFREECRGA